MARTRLYRDGKLALEDFPVADISEYVGQEGVCVWLDVCAPDQAELATIVEEFGLHPLAVEDAVNEHQRPKLDRYADHLFLTAYAVELDTATGELATREIAAFITAPRPDHRPQGRGLRHRRPSSPAGTAAGPRRHGVGFLLHGLLDHIVDGHFEAVQSWTTRSRTLRTSCSTTPPQARTCSGAASSCASPWCCAPGGAAHARGRQHASCAATCTSSTTELTPYYQDVYDHVLRATEWTESLRDLVTTILETNLTIQGNRLNVIMRKLTGWAAIIAVPTAITGFYGQNVPTPASAPTAASGRPVCDHRSCCRSSCTSCSAARDWL